jgi:hypothetical protein
VRERAGENPKFETNPNAQNSNFLNSRVGFGTCSGFRYSDFGFPPPGMAVAGD